MPSFDIVSQTDMQEVDNAVNSAQREIKQRYDFKGGKCSLELSAEVIKVTADDDFKLKQVHELLSSWLTRRKVDARSLDYGKAEEASGGSLRQEITVRQGIDQDTAKSISKKIRDAKLKVQAQIQGDQLRVSGKKRDNLQEVIELCKDLKVDLPLQYVNFRD
ncbi:MAG: YajQ family cyclic di-GMP-binding protein [Proteobacteria bacterium]|nr:YajQ family cyclic di-GMP-binding protein [Pseudomonadota bacterium]